jgi:hypothetical protein
MNTNTDNKVDLDDPSLDILEPKTLEEALLVIKYLRRQRHKLHLQLMSAERARARLF